MYNEYTLYDIGFEEAMSDFAYSDYYTICEQFDEVSDAALFAETIEETELGLGICEALIALMETSSRQKKKNKGKAAYNQVIANGGTEEEAKEAKAQSNAQFNAERDVKRAKNKTYKLKRKIVGSIPDDSGKEYYTRGHSDGYARGATESEKKYVNQIKDLNKKHSSEMSSMTSRYNDVNNKYGELQKKHDAVNAQLQDAIKAHDATKKQNAAHVAGLNTRINNLMASNAQSKQDLDNERLAHSNTQKKFEGAVKSAQKHKANSQMWQGKFGNEQNAHNQTRQDLNKTKNSYSKFKKGTAIAGSGVGVAAVTAGALAIRNKKLRDQYEAWIRKNPKSDLTFAQWKKQRKTLNEAFEIGYYEALEAIDMNYDYDDIFMEGYYDALEEMDY